ncbi:TetR/AcrR family transcriptional regulator [Streptomyces xanthophaeus]|uniref:TetR family transcriptional regulator n=1 Tax=Streptomyces xanthophaeus TaxID=67385 RepID=A0A919GUP6_9ACTN|nr:TetR/AcrR family transcriptional regulator [Streptomyces xanthophaeus]GHI85198.1 TetR family transcriptional regulator [Streptomyces xanthophaeus]
MTQEPPTAPGSPAWWAERRPAPSPPRRGRPPVDVGRIIDTALELVDEVGIQALTLRMLADALSSGTATLYRHFAGKDELLAHVVDKILGEVKVPPERSAEGSWREALEGTAEALYGTLRRHPNALPLLVAQVPVGPHALAHRERTLALLLGFGFPVQLAARAFTAVGHYVIGFAVQQHGPGAPGSGEQLPLREYYRGLDPVAFPATTAAAAELTGVSLDEEFAFGLSLLLDGLERARERGGER